jgi:hypothetical protein
VPEEAAGGAGTLDGAVGADVVTACVGCWAVGAAVTLGLAEMLAVRLGRLPMELATVPPHPAARPPTIRRAASKDSRFPEHHMLILPHCS